MVILRAETRFNLTVMGDCANPTGSILTPVHENWLGFASAFPAAVKLAKIIATMTVNRRDMISAPAGAKCRGIIQGEAANRRDHRYSPTRTEACRDGEPLMYVKELMSAAGSSR